MPIDVAFCKHRLAAVISMSRTAQNCLDDGNSSGCEYHLNLMTKAIDEVRVQCVSLRQAAGVGGAPRTIRVTLKDASRELRDLGMSLRKSDDEYRVTFKFTSPARAEALAYYTNDLDDAVATARTMWKTIEAQAEELFKKDRPATSVIPWKDQPTTIKTSYRRLAREK